MFRAAGWHKFFAKFQGFDDQVTLQFAKGFDGRVARIGGLVMEVSEKTVAHATSLSRKGDKWFKNKLVERDTNNRTLKLTFQNTNWGKDTSSLA